MLTTVPPLKMAMSQNEKPNPYFAQIKKYSRFIAGLHKFHEARLGPDEAIALARTFIKQRVAAREENFLNLVEKGIFQNPASPYLKLLQPKKIEFEDVKVMGFAGRPRADPLPAGE